MDASKGGATFKSGNNSLTIGARLQSVDRRGPRGLRRRHDRFRQGGSGRLHQRVRRRADALDAQGRDVEALAQVRVPVRVRPHERRLEQQDQGRLHRGRDVEDDGAQVRAVQGPVQPAAAHLVGTPGVRRPCDHRRQVRPGPGRRAEPVGHSRREAFRLPGRRVQRQRRGQPAGRQRGPLRRSRGLEPVRRVQAVRVRPRRSGRETGPALRPRLPDRRAGRVW